MSMSDTDLIAELLAVRLEMVEEILRLVIQDHPNREELERRARQASESMEVSALNSRNTDESMSVQMTARRMTLDAIFPEAKRALS